MSRHGHVEVSDEPLAETCRRYQVRELAIFGSALTDAYRPDSDVDILVEFEPDARVGLFRYIDLQRELESLFGRQVDLVSKQGLKPLIRDRVLESAERLFAA